MSKIYPNTKPFKLGAEVAEFRVAPQVVISDALNSPRGRRVSLNGKVVQFRKKSGKKSSSRREFLFPE
jgi:hypothetical protein